MFYELCAYSRYSTFTKKYFFFFLAKRKAESLIKQGWEAVEIDDFCRVVRGSNGEPLWL